ncbi:CDK5 regulatory subunit-associated protein 3 [Camarhynchus parvulus]|uniref:CDK5 regulatory subunit-associated protein 3 n=1 Tax=Geospiza parvula TaxID=87175 RepID=UPI0012383C2B|nr:CDK5 regulatory subunit-associated protein 3 [Camarhynchus parvulus]
MQAAPQDYRNVPIDIQTSKLLDWLLDRRHCGRRWPAQVAQVRERIRAALQDMPEHLEIRELLQGSYLHYFHCLRIVEILKGTEASTKNLFGRYSSQRMKDWQEIVSLYEKDNAYLEPLNRARVSPEITPNGPQNDPKQTLDRVSPGVPRCPQVSPSVPAVSPSVLPCPQGEDVRRELLAQVQALPSLLSRVGDGASALGDAIELYQACVAFVCDSPGAEAGALPLLRHVLSHGNSSVFRWRTGQEPLRLERPEPPPEAPEPPPQDTIDWGDFPTEPPQGGDIDWGITVEPSPQGDDGIDWGDGEKGQEGTITVVEAGTEAPEGVARGSDALTLLENPETRNQFIDELMELELFLAQRLLELEDEALDVVALSQFQLAPAALQGQSPERLRAQLATARELLGQLCSRSVQHLCMILASPRYVERVTALLRQQSLQAELLLAKREALGQRRRQALAEQAALEPQLQQLQERTRELQRLIEADISKRYGGRPVNLMGVNL